MEQIQNLLGKFMGQSSEEMTPEDWENFRVNGFNESEGNLNEEDGYNCTACRNKGLIMRAVQQPNGIWNSVSRECKCMGVRRTINRMKRSGLKNIIKDYTFDKFEATDNWQQTIKEAAMKYAKSPEGWFFIGGQSGAGKTHICTAICREFLLNGRAVKYMLWRDDIAKLKSLSMEAEQRQEMIDQFKNVDVLYIDDLFKTGKAPDGGKQIPTSADINAAFEILNFRYNDPSLLTIISSECTVNDILDIDEAVGGRIFERAKSSFSIKGDKTKNYRLRGAVEL